MTSTPIYVAGGCRTAFGKFGGAFRDATVTDLAVPLVGEVLGRTGLSPDDVEDLVFGNVLPTTREAPWSARIAALEAGIPNGVRTLVVNRACGTGLQAIVSAAEQIGLGRSDVAIAAGAEAFSSAPQVMWSRWGTKRGTPRFEDMLEWAYNDPFGNLMGETAEKLCDLGDISRDELDAYALLSQQRTEAARVAGHHAAEIVPVLGLAEDEFPRPGVDLERLRQLPSAYRDGGRGTAGNSSGVNDGAAAIAVLSDKAVERLGIEPDGRIVDWAVAGVEPELMGRGPVPATEAVLARTGMGVNDFDVYEVNEAFSAVALYAINELKLDPERTNPNGGAISIGHPPGATGIRLVVSALNELKRTRGRYGLVTMCLGGGMGMSMIVEAIGG